MCLYYACVHCNKRGPPENCGDDHGRGCGEALPQSILCPNCGTELLNRDPMRYQQRQEEVQGKNLELARHLGLPMTSSHPAQGLYSQPQAHQFHQVQESKGTFASSLDMQQVYQTPNRVLQTTYGGQVQNHYQQPQQTPSPRPHWNNQVNTGHTYRPQPYQHQNTPHNHRSISGNLAPGLPTPPQTDARSSHAAAPSNSNAVTQSPLGQRNKQATRDAVIKKQIQEQKDQQEILNSLAQAPCNNVRPPLQETRSSIIQKIRNIYPNLPNAKLESIADGIIKHKSKALHDTTSHDKKQTSTQQMKTPLPELGQNKHGDSSSNAQTKHSPFISSPATGSAPPSDFTRVQMYPVLPTTQPILDKKQSADGAAKTPEVRSPNSSVSGQHTQPDWDGLQQKANREAEERARRLQLANDQAALSRNNQVVPDSNAQGLRHASAQNSTRAPATPFPATSPYADSYTAKPPAQHSSSPVAPLSQHGTLSPNLASNETAGVVSQAGSVHQQDPFATVDEPVTHDDASSQQASSSKNSPSRFAVQPTIIRQQGSASIERPGGPHLQQQHGLSGSISQPQQVSERSSRPTNIAPVLAASQYPSNLQEQSGNYVRQYIGASPSRPQTREELLQDNLNAVYRMGHRIFGQDARLLVHTYGQSRSGANDEQGVQYAVLLKQDTPESDSLIVGQSDQGGSFYETLANLRQKMESSFRSVGLNPPER